MTFTPEERREIFQKKADSAARELVLAITALEGPGQRAGAYWIVITAVQDARGIGWEMDWQCNPITDAPAAEEHPDSLRREGQCADGRKCVNHCGSGPCSHRCNVCLRLAWRPGDGPPCPACPDAKASRALDGGGDRHRRGRNRAYDANARQRAT